MDSSTLIDSYCVVWGEPDAGRRQEMLQAVWAPGASYTDPTVHASGAAELSEHIGRVQAEHPGLRVVRTSRVDVHHGVARFAWQAVLADGKALPEGLDIAFLSPQGTAIERIVGFFGALKPRER